MDTFLLSVSGTRAQSLMLPIHIPSLKLPNKFRRNFILEMNTSFLEDTYPSLCPNLYVFIFYYTHSFNFSDSVQHLHIASDWLLETL
jgi:hypothetical protein